MNHSREVVKPGSRGVDRFNRPHRKLDVWKKAMELVQQVYRSTESFPREERYGLVSQMRRAAVSVVSNIAEGAARAGSRERLQFLAIAQGSLSELEAQVEVASMLGFMAEDTVLPISTDVGKMLRGLVRYHRSYHPSGPSTSRPHDVTTSRA